MSTFTHGGCSLLKATALVAALLLSYIALADNVHGTTPIPVHRTKLNCNPPAQAPLFDPVSTNRYALLLFFDKTTNVDDLFSLTAGNKYGCITDPDPLKNADGQIVETGQIVVQGSCPTDCGHASLDRRVPKVSIETGLRHTLGDPLAGTASDFGTYQNPLPFPPTSHPTAGWGIFFADPDGISERLNADDQDTKFRVWQIMAKDSCHAGKILKSLRPALLATGGYQGHIMIGYVSTGPHGGPNSQTGCKPVN